VRNDLFGKAIHVLLANIFETSGKARNSNRSPSLVIMFFLGGGLKPNPQKGAVGFSKLDLFASLKVLRRESRVSNVSQTL
jgi:hypothetical protein